MPEIRPETLRPLPLRVTQRQYLRLQAHRQIDQLAIQEHVRRALDDYLDKLDRKRPLERVAPSFSAGPPEEAGKDDGIEEEIPVSPADPAAKLDRKVEPAAASRVAKTPVPRPRPAKPKSPGKPQLAYR